MALPTYTEPQRAQQREAYVRLALMGQAVPNTPLGVEARAEARRRAETRGCKQLPVSGTLASAPVPVPVPAPAAPVAPAIRPPAPCGSPLASPLSADLTFDTFLVGASNELAVAAARAIAAGRSIGRCNPFVVYGAAGHGRTHLLQAMTHEAAGAGRRAAYFTATQFMYVVVPALWRERAPTVLDDIDLVLIDDVQFLNGVRVHEEFAYTLMRMTDRDRPVVIAADRAPADLEGIEARVKSRLGGGLLVELEAPDYAMRRGILEHRIAAQRQTFDGMIFPEDVVDFVASSVTTNGRDLDGAVNRLVAHNQLTGTPIDLKMAETALRDLLRARETKRPKIEDIQRVVSQHFNVSKQDLVSARRTRVIVRPRQIAMYLSKMLTPRSLPEIGRRFGDRDHTTVLHAVRKIEAALAKDPQTAEDIETLKRLLGAA